MSGKDLICTSAAKLNMTGHTIWQRLLPSSKFTAFGFATVVVQHSAAPQITENISTETIDPGKNIVGGKTHLQSLAVQRQYRKGWFLVYLEMLTLTV